MPPPPHIVVPPTDANTVKGLGFRVEGSAEPLPGQPECLWGQEEDLFIFNDTLERPRAPAVQAGRVTQA